jgi:hypothetical protein
VGKSVLGLLLGLLGAALFWLFRTKPGFDARRIHKRIIKLQVKKGVCGIESAPEDVELRRSKGDEVHWIITNPASGPGTPCHRAAEVCVGRWKRNGSDTEPPVNDRGNGQYCRTVKPGQTKTLPAHVKSGAEFGNYEYEILIDGQFAIDPIVRVVP